MLLDYFQMVEVLETDLLCDATQNSNMGVVAVDQCKPLLFMDWISMAGIGKHPFSIFQGLPHAHDPACMHGVWGGMLFDGRKP